MNKSAKMIYAIRILTIQYCTSSSVFVSEWVNDRKWVWEAQKILKNYANIATFQSDRVQVRRVQRNIIKSKACLNFCILNSFNNFFCANLIDFFLLSLSHSRNKCFNNNYLGRQCAFLRRKWEKQKFWFMSFDD